MPGLSASRSSSVTVVVVDDDVVDFIRREGSVQTEDVANRFGITKKAAQQTLRRLRAAGRLHRTSLRKRGHEDDGYHRSNFISEWKARA